MKNKNGNGIRVYFFIHPTDVVNFLAGEKTSAWPSAEGRARGGVRVRIDPDKVKVEEAPNRGFTIQKKGVKNHPAKERTKAAEEKPVRRETMTVAQIAEFPGA